MKEINFFSDSMVVNFKSKQSFEQIILSIIKYSQLNLRIIHSQWRAGELQMNDNNKQNG